MSLRTRARNDPTGWYLNLSIRVALMGREAGVMMMLDVTSFPLLQIHFITEVLDSTLNAG